MHIERRRHGWGLGGSDSQGEIRLIALAALGPDALSGGNRPRLGHAVRQSSRLTSSSGIPLLTRRVAVACRIRWEPNVLKLPPPA
jgi:hypothetical protein